MLDSHYPLIALMKIGNGVIYTEQFRNELEFEAFHKQERPAWITLIDKKTGLTIVQASYPQITLDI